MRHFPPIFFLWDFEILTLTYVSSSTKKVDYPKSLLLSFPSPFLKYSRLQILALTHTLISLLSLFICFSEIKYFGTYIQRGAYNEEQKKSLNFDVPNKMLMFVALDKYFHIGFVSNMWKSSLIPLET
jgi:hypothetical protein